MPNFVQGIGRVPQILDCLLNLRQIFQPEMTGIYQARETVVIESPVAFTASIDCNSPIRRLFFLKCRHFYLCTIEISHPLPGVQSKTRFSWLFAGSLLLGNGHPQAAPSFIGMLLFYLRFRLLPRFSPPGQWWSLPQSKAVA